MRSVKWCFSSSPPFLVALVYWAVIVMALVALSYLFFSRLLPPDTDAKPERIDVARMSLTVAAGFGGLVALVVSYRKQRDLEEGRFVERFSAASEQLGHNDAAVRMAGVYAMAGVVDRTRKMEQRQQCVDVLCGYLRLPYDPGLVQDHQTLKIVRDVPDLNKTEEIHYQYRQNDREVRKTIVRIIANRLRIENSRTWSKFSFDFTGAYLFEANFSNAQFSGASTSFYGTIFSGMSTSFARTRFSGVRTRFEGAKFSGKNIWFGGAIFDGESTSFSDAIFGGDHTSFSGAIFSGERVSFESAIFIGETDFGNPKIWDPAPIFDWNDSTAGREKPETVKPDKWPPTLMTNN